MWIDCTSAPVSSVLALASLSACLWQNPICSGQQAQIGLSWLQLFHYTHAIARTIVSMAEGREGLTAYRRLYLKNRYAKVAAAAKASSEIGSTRPRTSFPTNFRLGPAHDKYPVLVG